MTSFGQTLSLIGQTFSNMRLLMEIVRKAPKTYRRLIQMVAWRRAGAALQRVLAVKPQGHHWHQGLQLGGVSQVAVDAARARLGIDSENHYNFAVCGLSGSGKSTLINCLLGLRSGDAGAARTGVSETTKRIRSYDHPGLAHVKLWDIPGAGTAEFPASTYFDDACLFAFDAVLIVSAGRIPDVARDIAAQASATHRPVAFVWSKADQLVAGLRRDSNLSLHDARARARAVVQATFEQQGLGDQPLFVVSPWDMQDWRAGLDEMALMNYLAGQAAVRQAPGPGAGPGPVAALPHAKL
jgi:energy-coupling factor transporter ATP-binding protein EcfA2